MGGMFGFDFDKQEKHEDNWSVDDSFAMDTDSAQGRTVLGREVLVAIAVSEPSKLKIYIGLVDTGTLAKPNQQSNSRRLQLYSKQEGVPMEDPSWRV